MTILSKKLHKTKKIEEINDEKYWLSYTDYYNYYYDDYDDYDYYEN